MDIGVVIKKYRKEAGMTQEEMANRLGVTTPAVNKWENSNSKPDIELLAPIARLLDISLDTLLSFHEKLSDTEIEEIIRKMDRMFSEEGYEKTYEWALRLIRIVAAKPHAAQQIVSILEQQPVIIALICQDHIRNPQSSEDAENGHHQQEEGQISGKIFFG